MSYVLGFVVFAAAVLIFSGLVGVADIGWGKRDQVVHLTAAQTAAAATIQAQAGEIDSLAAARATIASAATSLQVEVDTAISNGESTREALLTEAHQKATEAKATIDRMGTSEAEQETELVVSQNREARAKETIAALSTRSASVPPTPIPMPTPGCQTFRTGTIDGSPSTEAPVASTVTEFETSGAAESIETRVRVGQTEGVFDTDLLVSVIDACGDTVTAIVGSPGHKNRVIASHLGEISVYAGRGIYHIQTVEIAGSRAAFLVSRLYASVRSPLPYESLQVTVGQDQTFFDGNIRIALLQISDGTVTAEVNSPGLVGRIIENGGLGSSVSYKVAARYDVRVIEVGTDTAAFAVWELR